jgi:hypothetical protein
MKAIAGMLIAAMLVVGFGCAKTDWIDRTLVTVDGAGTWRNVGSGSYRFELKQNGPNVSGFLQTSGGTTLSGPIEGSVAGDTLRFKLANASVEGEMRVTGDEMAGRIQGLPGTNTQFTLRRVDSSSPPVSPPR